MPLPATTPEQRRSHYADIESLVTDGFLTHNMRVRGKQISFRSLFPGDLFLMRHRPQASHEQWKTWTIASSIWMMDGFSLLEEPYAVPQIAQKIARLPGYLREMLLSVVLGLFSRQGKAIDGAEAFCYESVSRFMWRSYGRDVPSKVAGVPGVDRLGTNHVQRIWLAFNQMEDQRDRDRYEWETAKLITSSNAPKAVQKLDQKDNQRRQEEASRRQRVMDHFYYLRQGVITEDGRVKGESGGYVQGAHTVEELEDEMRKWVTGEQDEHDRVVARYKQKIRERFEQEHREMEARRAALRRAADERWKEQEQTGGRSMGLVAYSVDHLSDVLAGRRTGVRQVGWGNASRNYLHDKYLKEEPSPGVLAVEGGRVVEKPTLQEQIEQRSVTFRPGDRS